MNLGLITARGGSKQLPMKNVLPLKGKPLIAWTIEAAFGSEFLDQVYVSTENPNIGEISERYGAKVIQRPVELAGDAIGSEPVIEHAINYLDNGSDGVNLVCLLQPTSPMRTSAHIDEAFQIFAQEDADCVVSVFRPACTIAKSFRLEGDGSIKAALFDDAPYMRRQDLPTMVLPNGAIYIFTARRFLCGGRIPRTKVFPMIMSETESIDIDSKEDLATAERMLTKRTTM